MPSDKEQFISPYHSYKGEAKPHHIVFDANLQTFSQKVMFICALENGGKISPQDAYDEIKQVWKKLKKSKKKLLDNPDLNPNIDKDN